MSALIPCGFGPLCARPRPIRNRPYCISPPRSPPFLAADGLAGTAVACSSSSHRPRQVSHIRRYHCDHVQDCAKVSQARHPAPFSPAFQPRSPPRSMSSQQADTRIPAAASHWTKDTLDYLNAAYIKEDCTGFTFGNLGIPSQLREGLILVNNSNFQKSRR